MEKKSILQKKGAQWALKSFGLFLAGFINTAGVGFFLVPASFVDGGFSGVSFLLSYSFSAVPMGVFIFAINLPFFLFAWRKLGTRFVVSSIIAICSYALWMFVFDTPPNLGLSQYEKIIPAVFGGLLSGIGSGLTIRLGGSLDGVDVLSVYINKKTGIPVSRTVLVFNVIILLVAGFVVGWEKALFSIISYSVGVVAIDFVTTGFDKAKAVTIITDRGEEVARAISETFGRGVTVISSQGYYSKAEKAFIYCIVNRFEISVLKSVVHRADEKVFLTISDVSEVFGAEVKLNLDSLKRGKQGVTRIGAHVDRTMGTQVVLRSLGVTLTEGKAFPLSSLKIELFSDVFKNPVQEILDAGEEIALAPGVERTLAVPERENVTLPVEEDEDYECAVSVNGAPAVSFARTLAAPSGTVLEPEPFSLRLEDGTALRLRLLFEVL